MTIGLQHALSEVYKNYHSLNWWRNRVFIPFIVGTATKYYPRYPGYEQAVRVMDEEWDTLIILDACRADRFQAVADISKYDEYDTRISLGSHSSEWTRRNFQGKSYGDTVYVSANPHTSLEAGDAFHRIVELWETGFDDKAGVVLPQTVRDSAIETYKEFPNKRLIIHFMQPHGPFVRSDIEGVFDSTDEYWQAYDENLEYVLQYVDEIIDTIPGRTVITADHGQVYFEGILDALGLGGHKPRLRLPGLVNVPWAVIEDERRNISVGEVTTAKGEQVQERLRDLGYT